MAKLGAELSFVLGLQKRVMLAKDIILISDNMQETVGLLLSTVSLKDIKSEEFSLKDNIALQKVCKICDEKVLELEEACKKYFDNTRDKKLFSPGDLDLSGFKSGSDSDTTQKKGGE